MMTQTLTPRQRDVLTLWYQVNASLSAYCKLIATFGCATHALLASRSDWQVLGLHRAHLARYDDRGRADQSVALIERALAQGEFGVVFQEDTEYPLQLTQIFDPPPVLFYRGNLAQLNQPQIAIVGSRKPTPQAQKITFDLAQYLAQSGFVITSGLAMGVDKQAHLGALSASQLVNDHAHLSHVSGKTVGVMGTGIDGCYPKQHKGLFDDIVAQGGCLISELLPATPANKHTFPRRNRLVAGLSLATIVTEAALKSGSLITARLTSEQGKQVFAVPSHIDNANAEGCHHLIREGATLIYHPDQVIEDVKIQADRVAVCALSGRTTTPHLQSNTQVTSLPSTDHLLAATSISNTSTSQKAKPLRAIRPSQSEQMVTPSADPVQLPASLQPVFEKLDWHGQDLDALIVATELDTATLLGQLMELELLGVIVQRGGRYLRI